jgi:hypothetical protein
MTLPRRTADTMSDAIAMSSPSGRMSKRAHRAASRRLSLALFGPEGLTREQAQGGPTPQPTPRESMMRQARELRELAARGMSTKRYMRLAAELEAKAEEAE